MPLTAESSDEPFSLASRRLLSFLKSLRAFFIITLAGFCLVVKTDLSSWVSDRLGADPLVIGIVLIAAACAAWLYLARGIRSAALPVLEAAARELDQSADGEPEAVKTLHRQLQALRKFYSVTPLVTAGRALVCAALAGLSTLTGMAGWGCAVAMTLVAEVLLAKTIRLYRAAIEKA